MHTRIQDFDHRLIDQLLFPLESNEVIIESYLKVLLSGNVKKERNQVLYLVCSHHIRNYLDKKDSHADDYHDGDKNLVNQAKIGLSQEEVGDDNDVYRRGQDNKHLLDESMKQKLRRSIQFCRSQTLKNDLSSQ